MAKESVVTNWPVNPCYPGMTSALPGYTSTQRFNLTVRLESWKAGKLESWKAGKLESWKAGKLESWKAGKLESWKAGKLESWKRLDLEIVFSNNKKPFY
ncbi:hypothetical protein [Endozoicomonas numazuensis]|uniref:hypothetical protein n=1 Tax=Endozoicomonas numazuensis TaxID=1137799 RepID=UPI0013775D6C|nr:hypothetical protein [Endozoicomonas numazuensis]